MEQSILSKAQEHITLVLKGERSPFDIDRSNPFADLATEILNDLESTAKEYRADADYAKRTLDRSLPYVGGEAGNWNSLGNLQGTALSLERLATLFYHQARYAKSILVDYYEHQASK